MELHPAHVNVYTTQERSDLGTESFNLIRFLILNEENAMHKFVCTVYRYTLPYQMFGNDWEAKMA